MFRSNFIHPDQNPEENFTRNRQNQTSDFAKELQEMKSKLNLNSNLSSKFTNGKNIVFKARNPRLNNNNSSNKGEVRIEDKNDCKTPEINGVSKKSLFSPILYDESFTLKDNHDIADMSISSEEGLNRHSHSCSTAQPVIQITSSLNCETNAKTEIKELNFEQIDKDLPYDIFKKEEIKVFLNNQLDNKEAIKAWRFLFNKVSTDEIEYYISQIKRIARHWFKDYYTKRNDHNYDELMVKEFEIIITHLINSQNLIESDFWCSLIKRLNDVVNDRNNLSKVSAMYIIRNSLIY